MEAEEEGARDDNFSVNHREGVRSTLCDVDIVAIPGKGSEAIAVTRFHSHSNYVVFSGVGRARESAVFDSFVSDWIGDG